MCNRFLLALCFDILGKKIGTSNISCINAKNVSIIEGFSRNNVLTAFRYRETITKRSQLGNTLNVGMAFLTTAEITEAAKYSLENFGLTRMGLLTFIVDPVIDQLRKPGVELGVEN